MADREKVAKAVASCFDYWLDQHGWLHPAELENVRQIKADALALLKEQKPSEWVATEDIAFYGIRNGEAQYRKHYTYRCRECGRGSAIKEKYCPSCGAKMQGSVNADRL